MRLTTAVLAAGAAVAVTTAVIGAARLRQDAWHQAQRNDVVVTRNQLEWLAQMSTNPDLAKHETPEGMDVEDYMQLLIANRLICTLNLRDRLGFVRPGQLPFYASHLMTIKICRDYWARFGNLRTQEAEGDARAERFTQALDDAARLHQEPQTTAA